MFANIGTTEIIIIAVVLIVLFGAKFLPKVGKSLGESKVEMKKATKDLQNALKNDGNVCKEKLNEELLKNEKD